MLKEEIQVMVVGVRRMREAKVLPAGAEGLLIKGLECCAGIPEEPEIVLMRLIYLLRAYLACRDDRWLEGNVAWLHSGPLTPDHLRLESDACDYLNACQASGEYLPSTFIYVEGDGVQPFTGKCCQCREPLAGYGSCLLDPDGAKGYAFCTRCAHERTIGGH